MTTNKPEVVAYLNTNRHDPKVYGVSRATGDFTPHVRSDPLIRLSDYETLGAERDRLLATLERFTNANQARLAIIPRDLYLKTESVPGMRDALYEMDEAQREARAAIEAAKTGGET